MTVTISHLKNGLAVVSHRMAELETVALGIWVKAGSRDEHPKEAGIAHFLEHMAFKGTQRRTALPIVEEIEGRGGDLNAATSTETTGYTAHVLKEDWRTALDVIADIVTSPVFDPDEMERERGVILQEIAAAQDDPTDLVFEQVEQAAFDGNPLGRSVLGLRETVSRFSPDDLRAFRQRNYTAGRMVLSAAGNIRHDDLERMAEDLLSGMPKGGEVRRSTPCFTPGHRCSRRQQDQTHIVLAWEAPGYLHEDVHAMQALSSILGGGMSSRMFQELREHRGLCYSTYTYYSAWADTGLLYLYAATSPDDATEAQQLMRQLAQGMAEDVREAELDRARAQGRAALVMSLESATARAGQIARQYLAYGRVPEMSEFMEQIEAVTCDRIRKLAARTFAGEPAVSLVEGTGIQANHFHVHEAQIGQR